MADFKRKPMAAELTAALKAGVRDIPSAVVEPERDRSGEGEGKALPKAPPTVQVNFNASEEFAELIAELAQEAGSTRRLMARMFRDAGHKVPQADLQPFDNRRRARRH
jgi:hypothetical protein